MAGSKDMDLDLESSLLFMHASARKAKFRRLKYLVLSLSSSDLIESVNLPPGHIIAAQPMITNKARVCSSQHEKRRFVPFIFPSTPYNTGALDEEH